MMSLIDKVANNIINQNTCGFTGCFNPPDWKLEKVHILTTDGGEIELAGFQDIPINRVCDEHKNDQATAMLIANKAWGIVLRSIESENPGMIEKIGKEFRMKHFDLGWQKLD